METRTSKRIRVFVNEPIGSKPCTDLPGISVVLGKRLVDRGFGIADAALQHRDFNTSYGRIGIADAAKQCSNCGLISRCLQTSGNRNDATIVCWNGVTSYKFF